IFDGFQLPAEGDPICDTSTISSAIEAEYQPGLLRRSPVDERINAKRTMRAHQASVSPFQKSEARPPHQRPIGEDPEVLVALPGACVHRGGSETTVIRRLAIDLRLTGHGYLRN